MNGPGGMLEIEVGGPKPEEDGGGAEGKALIEAIQSGNGARVKHIMQMWIEDALSKGSAEEAGEGG